jgi:hypothetical protein
MPQSESLLLLYRGSTEGYTAAMGSDRRPPNLGTHASGSGGGSGGIGNGGGGGWKNGATVGRSDSLSRLGPKETADERRRADSEESSRSSSECTHDGAEVER